MHNDDPFTLAAPIEQVLYVHNMKEFGNCSCSKPDEHGDAIIDGENEDAGECMLFLYDFLNLCNLQLNQVLCFGMLEIPLFFSMELLCRI